VTGCESCIIRGTSESRHSMRVYSWDTSESVCITWYVPWCESCGGGDGMIVSV